MKKLLFAAIIALTAISCKKNKDIEYRYDVTTTGEEIRVVLWDWNLQKDVSFVNYHGNHFEYSFVCKNTGEQRVLQITATDPSGTLQTVKTRVYRGDVLIGHSENTSDSPNTYVNVSDYGE